MPETLRNEVNLKTKGLQPIGDSNMPTFERMIITGGLFDHCLIDRHFGGFAFDQEEWLAVVIENDDVGAFL
ncbi:hypothetical protein GCM10027442_38240 [Emticicia fontis]